MTSTMPKLGKRSRTIPQMPTLAFNRTPQIRFSASFN